MALYGADDRTKRRRQPLGGIVIALGFWCRALRGQRAHEQAQVLRGGNEPVLDLLPAQSAPARPLEVMHVGRLRKAALHHMRPPLATGLRRPAVRLAPRPLQEFLLGMALEGSSLLRARAMRA